MLSAQTPTFTPPAAAPRQTPELPPGIDIELADRVIYLFVADKLKTNDIADRLELSLHTVGLIIHSPYGVETRALLENLDEIRAEIHTRHQRMRAMAATAELCETAEREETRRLAAAAIIRGVPYYPREREPRTTNSTSKRSSTARSRTEPPIHERADAPAPTPTQAPAPAHPPTAQTAASTEPIELNIDTVQDIDDSNDQTQLAEEAAAIARVEVIRHRMAQTLANLRTARPKNPVLPHLAAALSIPLTSDSLTPEVESNPALTSSSAPLTTRARDAPQAA